MGYDDSVAGHGYKRRIDKLGRKACLGIRRQGGAPLDSAITMKGPDLVAVTQINITLIINHRGTQNRERIEIIRCFIFRSLPRNAPGAIKGCQMTVASPLTTSHVYQLVGPDSGSKKNGLFFQYFPGYFKFGGQRKIYRSRIAAIGVGRGPWRIGIGRRKCGRAFCHEKREG